DADGLAGVVLRAEKVEAQARMALADGGVVIRITVMALGEEVGDIDAGGGERRRERLRVEAGADVRDMRRGVEVGMQLAEAQMGDGMSVTWLHCYSTGVGIKQTYSIARAEAPDRLLPSGVWLAAAIECRRRRAQTRLLYKAEQTTPCALR